MLPSCLGVFWMCSLDHQPQYHWETCRDGNSQLASELFSEERGRVWSPALCGLTSSPRCFWVRDPLLSPSDLWWSSQNTSPLPTVNLPSHSPAWQRLPSLSARSNPVWPPSPSRLHRASVESPVGNPSPSPALGWALSCKPFASSSCSGLYRLCLAQGR